MNAPGSLGGQAGAAAFAIGAHLEASRSGFAARPSQIASTIRFDFAGIVAFGHHPDHRLGARGADDEAALARELRLGIRDDRL